MVTQWNRSQFQKENDYGTTTSMSASHPAKMVHDEARPSWCRSVLGFKLTPSHIPPLLQPLGKHCIGAGRKSKVCRRQARNACYKFISSWTCCRRYTTAAARSTPLLKIASFEVKGSKLWKPRRVCSCCCKAHFAPST